MKRHVRHSSRRYGEAPLLGQRVRRARLTVPCREHKIAGGGLPSHTERQPALLLFLPVCPQFHHSGRGEGDTRRIDVIARGVSAYEAREFKCAASRFVPLKA